MPIANIYIKFSHYDKEQKDSERVLTNKYEEMILDEVINKLQKQIATC